MLGTVIAVSRSSTHSFTKTNEPTITLIEGLGVEGDAHAGKTVKHRSRVARDPNQPNLRQVHLIQSELHDELVPHGFSISPGQMGENITTRGIDLLNLPRGTRLHIGSKAILEVTGLRNPCPQLDQTKEGLMKAVLVRDPQGNPMSKAGVMSIVVSGGEVRPNDTIAVEYPDGPQVPLHPI